MPFATARFLRVLAGDTVKDVVARLPKSKLSPRDLELQFVPPSELSRWLAAARRWPVKKLTLIGIHLDDAGLAALTRSAPLEHLTHLELRSTTVSAAAAKAIARWAQLSTLETLYIRRGNLRLAGATALLRSRHLGTLTTLGLPENRLADSAARAIAASTRVPSLTALDLAFNALTAAGAKALARSPLLGSLTHLGIAWNKLGIEGARSLARSPHLAAPRALEYLDLRGNGIPDDRAAGLLAHPQLTGVEVAIVQTPFPGDRDD